MFAKHLNKQYLPPKFVAPQQTATAFFANKVLRRQQKVLLKGRDLFRCANTKQQNADLDFNLRTDEFVQQREDRRLVSFVILRFSLSILSDSAVMSKNIGASCSLQNLETIRQ